MDDLQYLFHDQIDCVRCPNFDWKFVPYFTDVGSLHWMIIIDSDTTAHLKLRNIIYILKLFLAKILQRFFKVKRCYYMGAIFFSHITANIILVPYYTPCDTDAVLHLMIWTCPDHLYSIWNIIHILSKYMINMYNTTNWQIYIGSIQKSVLFFYWYTIYQIYLLYIIFKMCS